MNTENEWSSIFICDYVVEFYKKEIRREARKRRSSQ